MDVHGAYSRGFDLFLFFIFFFSLSESTNEWMNVFVKKGGGPSVSRYLVSAIRKSENSKNLLAPLKDLHLPYPIKYFLHTIRYTCTP